MSSPLFVPNAYDDEPTCTVDFLSVTGHATYDSLGREWGMEGGQDKGWITSAAPRTVREARQNDHGSTRFPAYREGHSFSIGGYVSAPTPALREQAELDLAGICSDPARLYRFRRRTQTYDHVRHVELDDAPQIEMVSILTLRWQLAFYAPDPRRLATDWQEPFATAATAGIYGLDFAGDGLDYSGAGLDYGTPEQPQVAQVVNLGSAPAYPLFLLTGPLSRPSIVHLESSRELQFYGDLAPGEIVAINCDGHPARGWPPHARISSVRGNVGALIPMVSAWPRIEPYTTASFALRASGGAGSGLRVNLRSAWL